MTVDPGVSIGSGSRPNRFLYLYCRREPRERSGGLAAGTAKPCDPIHEDAYAASNGRQQPLHQIPWPARA